MDLKKLGIKTLFTQFMPLQILKHQNIKFHSFKTFLNRTVIKLTLDNGKICLNSAKYRKKN